VRFISGQDLANGVILTPADVERELVYIVEQLENGTELLAAEVDKAADVALRLDLEQARALLKSKHTTVDRRKADVLEQTYDLHREKLLADTRVRMIRDSQHDLRAELEAVRSIGASVRSSMWEGQGTGGSSSGSRSRPQQPQGRSLDF
jgi:hypothetical protein